MKKKGDPPSLTTYRPDIPGLKLLPSKRNCLAKHICRVTFRSEESDSTSRLLSISEATTPNWETTSAICCANVSGPQNPTVNATNRTIVTNLNTAKAAAACTITNTKRSRITLTKSINGRACSADQFTVSASGGGTLTGTTSATTSGSGTSASTTFYSTPNTSLTLTDTKAAGPTALSGYFSNGSSASYTSALACTGTNGLSGITLTIGAGDTNIVCTYTNSRKTVSLTLRKIWVNAVAKDDNIPGTNGQQAIAGHRPDMTATSPTGEFR